MDFLLDECAIECQGWSWKSSWGYRYPLISCSLIVGKMFLKRKSKERKKREKKREKESPRSCQSKLSDNLNARFDFVHRAKH